MLQRCFDRLLVFRAFSRLLLRYERRVFLGARLREYLVGDRDGADWLLRGTGSLLLQVHLSLRYPDHGLLRQLPRSDRHAPASPRLLRRLDHRHAACTTIQRAICVCHQLPKFASVVVYLVWRLEGGEGVLHLLLVYFLVRIRLLHVELASLLL